MAEIAPVPADDEDEEMEDVSAGASKVAGPSVPTVTASGAGDKDDEDEYVETPVAAASANSTEETADGVDPNTMVMGTRYPSDILPVHVLIRLPHTVNGEAKPFSQVQDNEDLLDQMTADEYSVRDISLLIFRVMLTALSPPAGILPIAGRIDVRRAPGGNRV